MEMRPIAATSHGASTTVICENGAVFEYVFDRAWEEKPPIPGSDRHAQLNPDAAKGIRERGRRTDDEPELPATAAPAVVPGQ